MNSYVHIGMYNALKELGASEETARSAVADLPMPQLLASREDLQQVKAEIAEFRGEMKRELAILKFGYGPLFAALFIKIAFF